MSFWHLFYRRVRVLFWPFILQAWQSVILAFILQACQSFILAFILQAWQTVTTNRVQDNPRLISLWVNTKNFLWVHAFLIAYFWNLLYLIWSALQTYNSKGDLKKSCATLLVKLTSLTQLLSVEKSWHCKSKNFFVVLLILVVEFKVLQRTRLLET